MSSQKLKDLYEDLVEVLIAENIGFWDTDLHGPGVVIDVNRKPRFNHVIVIGNNPTWKARTFALSHEMGHLFGVTPDGELVKRLSIASEVTANRAACKLLDLVHPLLKYEYAVYYNQMNAGGKRAKFFVDTVRSKG